MNFSVWAPFAEKVELWIAGHPHPMSRGAERIWSAEVAIEMDTPYRFSIDGGPPLPDPRSRWQPNGVHGDSRAVDFSKVARDRSPAFLPKALRDAIIYELHVGTFTPEGTYAAAMGKLPHLADLGVTHVELMPVATFPGLHGWGYDGVFLYAPFPAYGTPADLAAFVSACHAHGLAAILDVVYNHFGPDGNYAGKYGPYFTDRWKTFWGEAINYDGPHSDEVRRFMIDNAIMWLRDYGFDGLRLDAVQAIYCTTARHFLEELQQEVDKLGHALRRDLVLIAEDDTNDPRLVRPPERGGYGLRAHWSDDFHHSLHAFFTGEKNGYYADFGSLSDIATVLREGYRYQGQFSVYRQRRHGRPPSGVTPDQLVVCSQNHDQVGNRAFGERLSMLLPAPRVKAAAALTLLSPFVPLLFQGEEWGAQTPFLYFTDHQDPTLGKAVAEGRRREFEGFEWENEIPNPQAPDTFRRSQLQWDELHQPARAEILIWYKRLIGLRKRIHRSTELPATRVAFDEEARWLTLATGEILTVFNFGAKAQNIPCPPGAWKLELASDDAAEAGSTVPPDATWIFVRN